MAKRVQSGRAFWEKEYKKEAHFALSETPSGDLQKFTRWLQKNYGKQFLNVTASVLDLGCGNGRNIVYLAQEFGMRGIGYDIADEAIKQARIAGEGLNLKFESRSIKGDFDIPDGSQTLVLDMMTSHFLNKGERKHLAGEINRVLKPGGWLFLKTFLREGDKHAKRMLKLYPSDEEGTYIHPEIGAPEHVYTIDEIEELLGKNFTIHKIQKSHGHMRKGRAAKRRSMSIYAQKKEF